MLLADVFQLKDQVYASNPNALYWAIFEDPHAFYELFGICFTIMDQLWTRTNAERKDFGKLTTGIKELLSKVLCRGPTNVYDFQQLANEIIEN